MSGISKMLSPDLPAMPDIKLPETAATSKESRRMPTEQDPALLAASRRTRERSMRRRGRMSTILTDQVKSMTGSSGTKLGA
jgi:hypothetical protein